MQRARKVLTWYFLCVKIIYITEWGFVMKFNFIFALAFLFSSLASADVLVGIGSASNGGVSDDAVSKTGIIVGYELDLDDGYFFGFHYGDSIRNERIIDESGDVVHEFYTDSYSLYYGGNLDSLKVGLGFSVVDYTGGVDLMPLIQIGCDFDFYSLNSFIATNGDYYVAGLMVGMKF